MLSLPMRGFERGKEAVVGVLEPDHFFGEGCLNGHPLRVTTATAIDQCLITRITKAAMIATLHDEPEFSQLFMARLVANFGKEATVEPIIGKFSQETLAEMIGTTRSRVSFFMNKFRKLGYIEYNGKLEIRNSLLNVVLYNDGELDLALLDVKNRVRLATLRKNDLVLLILGYGFPIAHFGEKCFPARMRPSYSSSRRSPLPRTKARIMSGNRGSTRAIIQRSRRPK